MSLEQLLSEIQARRLILISERELWPDPRVTPAIMRAMKKHRSGLALLIRWASIDVCPSKDLHRKHWRYGGAGRFTCEVCERCKRRWPP